MRIVHVTHSLDPLKGGTSVAVRSLAEGCAAQGVASPIVVLDAPDSAWLEGWDVPIRATGPSHTHFGWNSRLVPVLHEEVKQADLVIVHGLWQYHNVAVRQVCSQLHVPYIVCPHGMLAPWAVRQSRLTKKLAWRFVVMPLVQKAAALCFTTEYERTEALQTLGGGLSLTTLVQPLGVDAPSESLPMLRAEFAKREAQLAQQRIVLFLGRLHPKKGCDLLIEGFARWRSSLSPSQRPMWHLRLSGPPDSEGYLKTLRELAQHYGLTEGVDISFPGMVSGRLRWEEMASADVFVLPSHQENFAIVVGEALACGRPVLLSDRVNTWPWVVEAGAGLVAPDTAAGVEQLLGQWAAMPGAKQAEYGRNARALFERQFAMPARCSSFIEAFKGVVSKSAQSFSCSDT